MSLPLFQGSTWLADLFCRSISASPSIIREACGDLPKDCEKCPFGGEAGSATLGHAIGMSPNDCRFNRSPQHTRRTSLLVSDTARSFWANRARQDVLQCTGSYGLHRPIHAA